MEGFIKEGKTSLGIEFGSTRIKAVLTGPDHIPIASGAYDWENRLENGVWTYSTDDIWKGLQGCYASLREDVKERYNVELIKIGSIGISAMMHGYLAFDKESNLLVPFRTWRNTTTEQAASFLTKKFSFNIPQRWSIAHLYQAILNKEEHVNEIEFITTLAGYVHWKLTGQKVLGVGDASGMFPIGSDGVGYDKGMLSQFDKLVSEHNFSWNINDILPTVLQAGQSAGSLTAEGAKLLDDSGKLQGDIPMCPPEGDAGTGMVATNSVAARTGNVSAGTSIFAMIVLEKELSQVYTEIDMVTTPTGKPVAMVHCNNCTSDLDAWVKLFAETLAAAGTKISKPDLYSMLYNKALEGEKDAGGLLSYNYYSGEPITDLHEGRPLLVRLPNSKLSLANFMRAQLLSILGTLKIGMDILTKQENVELAQLLGHGGFFKAKGVGQNLMASALEVPVSVMESAGEGGAWGIAVLADYMINKSETETLEAFLENNVFKDVKGICAQPDAADVQGFELFMDRYVKGLSIEKSAVENLK